MNYLKELYNLEVLTVSNTQLVDLGIEILSSVVKYLPKLKALDISYAMTKHRGLFKILNEINKFCRNIESLIIDENEICNESATELNKFLLSHLQLKRIVFSCKNLDEQSSNVLIEGFKNLYNLEELSISNFKVNPNTLKLLFTYLKQNNKMKELTIQYCKFDNSMITQFEESLKCFNDLEALCLQNCNLDNTSISYLKEGLKNLHQLVVLDLSYNNIDLYGVGILCLCFNSLQVLNILKLEYNLFGIEGILILSNNIEQLHNLKNLYIMGNNFGEAGIVEILDTAVKETKIIIQNSYKRLCKIYSIEKLHKIIHLIKGEDRGRKAWYYLEIEKNNYEDFIAVANGSNNINLDDFGNVIYSAYGDNPPQDIRNKVDSEYPNIYE